MIVCDFLKMTGKLFYATNAEDFIIWLMFIFVAIRNTF